MFLQTEHLLLLQDCFLLTLTLMSRSSDDIRGEIRSTVAPASHDPIDCDLADN